MRWFKTRVSSKLLKDTLPNTKPFTMQELQAIVDHINTNLRTRWLNFIQDNLFYLIIECKTSESLYHKELAAASDMLVHERKGLNTSVQPIWHRPDKTSF